MAETKKTEYEVKKLNFPNMKVTVLIPIRTPEEWAKRREAIAKAAANLMKG